MVYTGAMTARIFKKYIYIKKEKLVCLALLQSRVWWWRKCVSTSCLHYKWRDKCNVLFKRSFPPKPHCILLKRSSSRAAGQCSPLLHPGGGGGLLLFHLLRIATSSVKISSFSMKSCTWTHLHGRVNTKLALSRLDFTSSSRAPFSSVCSSLVTPCSMAFLPTSVTPDLSKGTLTSSERWRSFRQETGTHNSVSFPRWMKCNLEHVSEIGLLVFKLHLGWGTSACFLAGHNWIHVLQRISVKNLNHVT